MVQRWRGSHHFDSISATRWDGLQGTPGRKVIYVDSRSWGSGNDSLSGYSPDSPLATIAAAIDKCSDGKHDYIFCLDGYDNDESTIEIDVTSLHIIGLSGMDHRAPFVWLKIAGTGGAAVFTLKGSSSANCEIAGFTLGADSSHPCITTETGGSTELIYGWLHHLAFAASLDASFVAYDGILEASGTGLDGCLIEDCYFGAQLGRDGIRFVNFYGGLIRRNVFRALTGVGVHQTTGGAATGSPDILNNWFFQKTAPDKGAAITITDSGGGIIDGNHAVEDGGHAGNNLYLDTTTGTDTSTKNGWGLNYQGDNATYPAFS